MKKLIIIFGISLLLPLSASADITTGLQYYYTFDEGSGTTAANTGSAGGATATLVNSAGWTLPGKVGTAAINLNSANARGVVSTTVSTFNQGAGSYSVAAWVYMTNIAGCPSGTDSCAFVSSIGNSGNGQQGDFFLGVRSGSPAGVFQFANWQGSGSSNYNYRTDSTLATLVTDNSWFHLVGTYDGVNGKLYINGVEQPQASAGTTGAGDSLGAYVGTLYTGADSYHLKGNIDELRVYNRALSSPDVLELYNYTGNVPPTPSPTFNLRGAIMRVIGSFNIR